METAVYCCWLLTMTLNDLPPIIDANYKDEVSCEKVKAEVGALYPSYTIYCTPLWKQDKPAVKRKVYKKKAYAAKKKPVARKKPTTRRR